jgi:hypothetical protein
MDEEKVPLKNISEADYINMEKFNLKKLGFFKFNNKKEVDLMGRYI